MESLANKYRPQTFDQVCEQSTTTTILKQQLKEGTVKNAYLFVGSAGTGKTSLSRIFAREVNHGKGSPLEIDAASNNSVDDIRNIIQQAKTQSLDSEYRIFTLDECHMLSNSAWNAMLKVLEEPPKKSIFILCTTNPEKIQRTILSRVQRFDFKRISQQGIIDRLKYVLDSEKSEGRELSYTDEAISYLARISEGGMRDALSLTDKCLAYSSNITLESVIDALGAVDYDVFFDLSEAMFNRQEDIIIKTVETVHADGKDLKQFVKDFQVFLLDVNKYDILHSFDYMQMPATYEDALKNCSHEWFECCRRLLPSIVNLNSELKWETQPKCTIEAELLREVL